MNVKFHPLKIIYNSKGNILHALKKSDKNFDNFGEAYFSEIKYKEIKAWKCHKLMKMNLIVPYGKIKFVFLQNKKYEVITLSKENYGRISVEPNIWFGFQGLQNPFSLLLNIANIEHLSDETLKKDLKEFNYNWL